VPWLAADLEVGGDGVLRWWEEYVRRLDSGHYHVTHLLPADQVLDGEINSGDVPKQQIWFHT